MASLSTAKVTTMGTLAVVSIIGFGFCGVSYGVYQQTSKISVVSSKMDLLLEGSGSRVEAAALKTATLEAASREAAALKAATLEIKEMKALVRNLTEAASLKAAAVKGYEDVYLEPPAQSNFIPLSWIKENYVSFYKKYAKHVAWDSSCMSQDEDKQLEFALGYASAGHFLEVGAFCGCSAVQIVGGMEKRRKDEQRDQRYRFFTADLFPAMPGSGSPHTFEYVESDKGLDGSTTQTVQLNLWGQPQYQDPIPKGDYLAGFGPHVDRPGGMLHCMYTTLWENGGKDMMDRVSIVAGGAHHVPLLPYRTIFTDSAHDLGIVAVTKNAWDRALGRGYPVIIAFHDTANHPDRAKYLATYYRAEDTFWGSLMFAIQVPRDWKEPFPFDPKAA